MTSSEIQLAANRGNIAGPDIDLDSLLFNEIIPEFMADLDSVSWRYKRATTSVAAGSRTFDVPSDFERMEAILVGDSAVSYIGENQAAVLAAEATTEQGVPSGWYFTPDSNSRAFGTIKFDRPLSTTETVYYSYRWSIPNSGPVDLGLYIPTQWHAGLIEGLRREIYLDRWGAGDRRVDSAMAKFTEWKQRAQFDRELAPAGAHVITLR